MKIFIRKSVSPSLEEMFLLSVKEINILKLPIDISKLELEITKMTNEKHKFIAQVNLA